MFFFFLRKRNLIKSHNDNIFVVKVIKNESMYSNM